MKDQRGTGKGRVTDLKNILHSTCILSQHTNLKGCLLTFQIGRDDIIFSFCRLRGHSHQELVDVVLTNSFLRVPKRLTGAHSQVVSPSVLLPRCRSCIVEGTRIGCVVDSRSMRNYEYHSIKCKVRVYF